MFPQPHLNKSGGGGGGVERMQDNCANLVFPTSQAKRASENTYSVTNQNSSDVTAVFTYSHLNTAIDQ